MAHSHCHYPDSDMMYSTCSHQRLGASARPAAVDQSGSARAAGRRVMSMSCHIMGPGLALSTSVVPEQNEGVLHRRSALRGRVLPGLPASHAHADTGGSAGEVQRVGPDRGRLKHLGQLPPPGGPADPAHVKQQSANTTIFLRTACILRWD